MTTAVNQWLESISGSISSNLWLAPLLALLAGILTAFSPCCLSSVPLVIGYVGGTGQKDTKRAFLLSLTFSAGSALTFTALGTVASLLGKFMAGAGSWWFLILGVLMVFMALETMEILNVIPSTHLISKNKRRGFIGAFLAGVLGGLFSSPCATPVLVVLLAFVAKEGNPIFGILLLLLYAAGHSLIYLAAGTSVGFVQKLSASGRYGAWSKVLRYLLGFSILILGFYLLYLGF